MAPTPKKRIAKKRAPAPARERQTPLTRVQNRISEQEDCSICFETCEGKCYAEKCLHSFCFRCLDDWCKINSSCPLCRTKIRRIYHNVSSTTEYTCYRIPVANHEAVPYHWLEFHDPNLLRELSDLLEMSQQEWQG